jgi:hypothetical protein
METFSPSGLTSPLRDQTIESYARSASSRVMSNLRAMNCVALSRSSCRKAIVRSIARSVRRTISRSCCSALRLVPSPAMGIWM